MSEIFDESNMRRILETYIPAGETLLAGIHAVSKETQITGVFGKCVRTESKLIPDENGGTIALNKKKYAAYDVYIGITQSFLIIAECERNKYYYQFWRVCSFPPFFNQLFQVPITYSVKYYN